MELALIEKMGNINCMHLKRKCNYLEDQITSIVFFLREIKTPYKTLNVFHTYIYLQHSHWKQCYKYYIPARERKILTHPARATFVEDYRDWKLLVTGESVCR